MGKTAYIDGTIVDTNFLNGVYGGDPAAAWAADTAVVVGHLINKSGWHYRCIVAGTTGSSEPSWPTTLRSTVVDGGVTWEYFEGHQHDGKAMDGSSSKVLLTGGAEVQGLLPRANIAGYLPIGTILPYYGTTAPDANYLVCDGSTFNATTYPDLNTLLGGNTLPNLKGKFLVGYNSTDSDYNALGKTGGQKNMPKHGHTLGQYGSTDPAVLDLNLTGGGSTTRRCIPETTDGNVDSTFYAVTQTGSGTIADDNRPPFATVNYIIVAK